ncbi:MAG: hypothetical protein ACD_58C00083G0001, partial [uncultured bacterium]
MKIHTNPATVHKDSSTVVQTAVNQVVQRTTGNSVNTDP